MKVKELLSDKSKWTKKAYARAANDNPIGPEEDNAVCWCLVGAVLKCYPDFVLIHRITTRLSEIIYRRNGYSNITLFNDATTFEKLREVLEEADV